jgi:hypothetical protein
MTVLGSYIHTEYPPQPPVKVQQSGAEMSRLINAALVDCEFCRLLLSNPSAALSKGYNGECFDLSEKERIFVLTVQAKTLTDFAVQWVVCKDQVSTIGDIPLPILLNCSVM